MNKPDQDKLLDYVMGSLTPEEEKDIARYLGDHPEEAAEVQTLFTVMAETALSQEPASIADDAEESLLSRIRQQDTTLPADELKLPTLDSELDPKDAEKAKGVNPWWFALAAGIALVAYMGLRTQIDPIARQLASLCAESSVECQVLTGESDAQIGTLAKRANNALLLVFNEDPPAGQVYQAWEIVEGEPTSLGVWEGRILDIDTQLARRSVFGVSLEPLGGSEEPTSTPLVVVPLS